MKALVVDDESLARERLIDLLADIESIEVVGEAADGREAIDAVQRLLPDLVLMDIRMPCMDGLEAARHLGALQDPPAIVFCTAYDEHALAAFDANAVDYLLKPIRAERLRAAIERAGRFSGEKLVRIENASPVRRERSHLCARVRGSLVLVPIVEIDYLLAEDKYVIVHYAGNQVLIEEPLKMLEIEFGDRFVRIHRNCLVALDRLAGLTRTTDGRVLARLERMDASLEVSRRNLPALRKLVRSL
ncbi:MAG: response regulator transcription factor [Dokdonella sp.]|jgi:two-component system response regulator AlgR|uniref:LytR/AlgR family response regulator transcription factor n=1 Tax=Dokdonella sp. TaxID=2291710 RepID=UPI0025BBF6CE|nr:LytTR family DNA-binding domain-containing protein [Dokdonella sp.]MBK8124363.1 response regulator transcription factor [Dokdonella sp.]HNV08006.1 LytTR family DNA-binding domain-containing protein [Dokdonella sp.]HPW03512.1 LytTR family DNA-binding domain-containing protein [Dokdonella sp.]